MFTSFRSCFVAAISLISGVFGLPASQAQAERSNRLTIPIVERGPEIDGKMSDGEWDHAVAVSGFIDQFDNVASSRNVIFYLQADSEYLYLAQKSGLRPGEAEEWKRKGAAGLAQPIWFYGNDSTASISIAAGEVVNADVPSIFQYSVNPLEKFNLWKNEWAPLWGGTIRARGGEQNFRYKKPDDLGIEQSVNEEKTIWISEIRIPLDSLGVQELQEGDEWKVLLARDYPQGDQTAWTYCPDWQFSGRWSSKRFVAGMGFYNTYTDEAGYAKTTFSATAPVVRVLDWGEPAEGLIEPQITIFNPGDKAAKVKVSMKHAVVFGAGVFLPEQVEAVEVPAGGEVQVHLHPIEAPADRASTVTLSVTDQEDTELMFQSLPLNPVLPIAGKTALADLSLKSTLQRTDHLEIFAYDPIRNHLNLEVKGMEERDGARVHDVVLTVRKEGEAAPFLEEKHLIVDDGSMSVHGRHDQWSFDRIVELPELDPGLYEVTATSRLEDGTELAIGRERFIRYDHEEALPWLNNEIGVSDQVLNPWTPIQGAEKTDSLSLEVVGRTIEVGGSGLWTGVQVNDQELLASPVRLDLIRDGAPIELKAAATPRDVQMADHEASWEGSLTGGGWNINVQGRLEYDGYNEFKITFDPPAENADVDAIRLVVPLPEELGHLLHATGGVYMRSQVSTLELPKEEGQVWNSGMSRSGNMNGARLRVGNFKPYVWLGNGRSGVSFMADNDEGWVPSENIKNPEEASIEVERKGETVSLVLNLVARPFTFTKPREVLISLQPTPIKPFQPDWRERRNRLNLQTAFAPSTADGWSYDGQKWRGKDNASFGGFHGNQHFPLNWDLNRERVEVLASGHGLGSLHPKGTPYLPYQVLNGVIQIQVEDDKVPGLQGAGFLGYLGAQVLSTDEIASGSITKQDMDHRLFRYKKWIEEVPISGFYFDNSFPGMSKNPWAGQGYFLDLPDRPNLDGKIQSSYNLVNMREFFKRLRTVLVEEGRRPYIWLHATDSLMVGAYAFADVMLLGETLPKLNSKQPWFSSKYPPSVMQATVPQLATGFPTDMLDMMGNFNTEEERRAAYRDADGWRLLHDTDGEGMWPMILATERGLDLSQPIEYFPYWDESIARIMHADKPEIYVSAWRQNGGLKVVVFNRNDTAAVGTKVIFDFQALGMETPEGGWVLKDLEDPKQSLEGESQGETLTMRLDVPSHDYRMFTIMSQAATEAEAKKAQIFWNPSIDEYATPGGDGTWYRGPTSNGSEENWWNTTENVSFDEVFYDFGYDAIFEGQGEVIVSDAPVATSITFRNLTGDYLLRASRPRIERGGLAVETSAGEHAITFNSGLDISPAGRDALIVHNGGGLLSIKGFTRQAGNADTSVTIAGTGDTAITHYGGRMGGTLTKNGTGRLILSTNLNASHVPFSNLAMNGGELLSEDATTTSLTWSGGQLVFALSDTDDASNTLTLSGSLTKGGGPYEFDFQNIGMANTTYTLITFANTDFEASDFSYTGAPAGGSFKVTEDSVQFTTGSEPYAATEGEAIQVEEIEVYNLGTPGQNSIGARNDISKLVLPLEPDWVLIYYGLNDALNSKRFVELPQFISNLERLVELARENGITPVLTTIHFCGEEALLTRHKREAYGEERPNEKLERFNQAIREFAKNNEVALVDFEAVSSAATGEIEWRHRDGVHLTPEGYELLADTFYEAIEDDLNKGQKIACFGDSVTSGVGTKDRGTTEGDTYPAFLKRRVNAAD